jgi:hypothetical protein
MCPFTQGYRPPIEKAPPSRRLEQGLASFSIRIPGHVCQHCNEQEQSGNVPWHVRWEVFILALFDHRCPNTRYKGVRFLRIASKSTRAARSISDKGARCSSYIIGLGEKGILQ